MGPKWARYSKKSKVRADFGKFKLGKQHTRDAQMGTLDEKARKKYAISTPHARAASRLIAFYQVHT